jgi:hypothetical protein
VSAEAPQANPASVDPDKNPSYPQRTHVKERTHWEGVLKHWQEKIDEESAKLGPNSHADRHRLFSQMLGARDQIAEAVRRLPQEMGDLYTEDKHRLELAVASLERIFRAWN